MSDPSYDARTGTRVAEVPTTPATQVRAVLARAATVAPDVAATHPAVRRDWLYAVAAAVEVPATAADLVEVADRETALGPARLTSELARCAAQLRFYGDVAVEGSWLGVTLDRAAGPTPDLRRLRVPLGPVAVLGASNFPFAFGSLGNDTGSALAAGCPVVAKAHPAHPETARLLTAHATAALEGAGAPRGTFDQVAGFAAGAELVSAPETAAVAFTGSQHGGLALWRLANERDVVIPVFAEMGTVNPVVVTPGGARRAEEIAGGFVASFSLGMGQFCTKPGLLLVPAGQGVPARVAAALTEAAPTGWLLTEAIASSYRAGIEELESAGGTVLAHGAATQDGWSGAVTLMGVPAERLVRGSRLLGECFGPVALVAEYAGLAELRVVLGNLQGALAGSVWGEGPDDPDLADLVSALAPRVGRVMVDQWPTGVAFTWAQQHGGPWPATTVPAATSVGAAALERFTRPVAWQNVPQAALPPALREDNPWGLPRRVDGVLS